MRGVGDGAAAGGGSSAARTGPEPERAPPPARGRARRAAGLALRLGLSVALLALVWRAVDGPAALERLATADFGLLLVAFVAIHLQTLASAARWRLTAARLGHRFGLGRALGEYYLAQLVNQTLPGGVLGDAGRAARAGRDAGLLRAAESVALERLAGQAGFWALALPALLLAIALSVAPEDPARAAGLAAALVALGLGAPALLLLAARRLARRRDRLGRRLALLGRDARRAFLAPGARGRQAALSLATAALNVAAFALCLRAVDADASLPAALAAAPAILATMLVPVSVAGWGVREAAAAAVWPLIGGAAQTGVAASLAFGLLVMAASLPGLLVLPRAGRAAQEPPGRRRWPVARRLREASQRLTES